ncbi:hypothetical protein JJB98_23155 [Bradyrhizobium diazoefficiens]|nr:hypothetical protein [Bradyrhizobium diazoefficiens]QQO22620.1 hypothetical protein JJB98_23155 [Bradyrhizobium diazoefficiens]
MIVQRISDSHISRRAFRLASAGCRPRTRRVIGNAVAQNIRASAMRNDFARTGEQERVKEQFKP